MLDHDLKILTQKFWSKVFDQEFLGRLGPKTLAVLPPEIQEANETINCSFCFVNQHVGRCQVQSMWTILEIKGCTLANLGGS